MRRDDASSVAVRAYRSPTRSANGFNLVGTLTTPPAIADRLRSPAIVLIWRLGSDDRDETVVGIPVFAQLAKSLADGGFIVLRYDERRNSPERRADRDGDAEPAGGVEWRGEVALAAGRRRAQDRDVSAWRRGRADRG